MREHASVRTEQPPDYFTRYSCSSDFVEAAFQAKETSGSFEIQYEQIRDLMLEHELNPTKAEALAITASARAETMILDLGVAVLRLEQEVNRGDSI